jgi:cation diffusion facilitator CzcD-associated flavoprotein CzcO
MSAEHVDVLIVGAGISGVGAAYHLGERCPGKSYAILEAREDLGGTWDLFRYPGIRSDSDMHTLGFRFKPWTEAKAIADGPSIHEYIRRTAREEGIEPHIRFGHRVVSAAWSTADAQWSVEAVRTDTGETVELTCGFIAMCSGYYRYDEGYRPAFEGIDDFEGELIHPQHWPEDLDHEGKRIVVVGSGATAVTLVPALAEKAAKVTMLQRSPSYIVSLPGEDRIANGLRRVLPAKTAYAIARWKNVLLQMASYQLSRRRPNTMRRLVRRGVEKALPPGYDVDRHFEPAYNPWDQRLCLVPDGDLFEAISSGRADIVTDTIERFTKTGLRLASGEDLEADVIVTATGLNLQFLGGVELTVDGVEPDIASAMTYKGMMLSDVPNMAFTLGYSNASWTLKVDLTSEYMCRLINYMDEHGYRQCVPRATDPSVTIEPLIGLNSNYILRSLDHLPKQGSKEPWKLRQNYAIDLRALRHGPVVDDAMQFSSPPPGPAPGTEELAAEAV